MSIISKLINGIFSIFPTTEVLARKVYWSSDFFINKKNKKKKSIKINNQKGSLTDLENSFRGIGIKKGSLVILHSGFGEIKNNISLPNGPLDVINCILNIIGEEGTLAIPTHPLYPVKIDRNYVKDILDDNILTFDVKKTKAWTGAIANSFLSLPGVIRSHHPINTLAAIGPLSEIMMKDNISGDQPLPCGLNSSWKYCADHDAFIVGLGVDLVHSLTMIHVAEDMNPVNFPQNEWYTSKGFKVISDGKEINLKVRERKHKYAINYAERSFKRDLMKNKILTQTDINGLLLEYIESSVNLIQYLNSRNHTHYPYRGVKFK
jgi:aminoglycoside 3-N-acetyltransferase